MTRRQLIRAALLTPVAHAVTRAAPKADVFDRAALDRVLEEIRVMNVLPQGDGMYWMTVHPTNLEWIEMTSSSSRWPYGGPDYHEACCVLHQRVGLGECDCKASDASDTEWGEDGNAPASKRERENLARDGVPAAWPRIVLTDPLWDPAE